MCLPLLDPLVCPAPAARHRIPLRARRIAASNLPLGVGPQVRTFSIDGSIQMKSYLSGSPELHLALNDDLAIAHMLVS